jgi:purine-binding chemotaxis protein CheW
MISPLDGSTRHCLSFIVGNNQYGIDTRLVQDVGNYMPPTQVANAPPSLMGMINHRGVITPVIDLRIKFGQPAPGYDTQTAVVVLSLSDWVAAVVVDGIGPTLALPQATITPADAERAGRLADYLDGLCATPEGPLALLDIERLLERDGLGIFTPPVLAPASDTDTKPNGDGDIAA